MNQNRMLAAFAGVSLLALASPALAQREAGSTPSQQPRAEAPVGQEESNATGDIVVTAQRREERLLEVPLSVTVADQATLERQQVNSISDLSRISPALEIQQAPGQNVGGGGQVRGVGTTTFQIGAVGSVGVVVDQVSQGNANISNIFDIERVEVLKGPQGTLFGLTTSAGVINITTRAPQFGEFAGRIRTELSDAGTLGSDFGRQLVQGVVNVPIAATAAARISGNYTATQGVNRNTLTGKLDDHDAWGLRGRLLWDATDRISVNLIGDYAKSKDDGRDFFVLYKANAATAANIAGCGIVASPSNRDYCTNTNHYDESETIGGSLQVDYKLDNATLTSVTAARRQDVGPGLLNIFRLDVRPQNIFVGPANSRVDLLTQELRLASAGKSFIDYTVGAFFSKQTTDVEPQPFQIRVRIPTGAVIPVVNTVGPSTDVSDRSWAVFGQGTVHATDQLNFILGGRYTKQDISVRSVASNNAAGGAAASINNFSFKAGAQYDFTRDIISYATVSQGYKGPQIALADPSNPAASTTLIRQEIPTSYEAGLKSTLMGGRLLTEVSLFRTRVRNYQGQVCQTSPTGGLQCVPQNIGNVVSKGIELSANGRVARGFNLNTGLIYNKVSYPAGFVGNDGAVIGGTQLTNAPKWKFTASGEYATAVTSGVEGFISADAIYKSKFKLAPALDPNSIYPGNWTLGGRIGVRGEEGRWSASVFVRNATNNHEPVLALRNFPDGQIGSYGQILTPQSFRQVGASLDLNF